MDAKHSTAQHIIAHWGRAAEDTDTECKGMKERVREKEIEKSVHERVMSFLYIVYCRP